MKLMVLVFKVLIKEKILLLMPAILEHWQDLFVVFCQIIIKELKL